MSRSNLLRTTHLVTRSTTFSEAAARAFLKAGKLQAAVNILATTLRPPKTIGCDLCRRFGSPTGRLGQPPSPSWWVPLSHLRSGIPDQESMDYAAIEQRILSNITNNLEVWP